MQTNGAVRAVINADKDGIDLIQVPTLTGDPQLTFEHDASGADTVTRDVGNWGAPVVLSVNQTLLFEDNGGSELDTITRSEGSWLDDGFRAQQWITVSNSTENDGRYRITAISVV